MSNKLVPCILYCCLSASIPLSAATAVSACAAYPDAIILNTPTVVTVKAQLGTGPDLLSNSVNVIRLNAQGVAIGIVGTLFDDGAHGDSIAGDGIFSGQFTFNEAQISFVNLAVTAAIRGSLLRIRSSTFTISVVQPQTDITEIAQTQTQAVALYDTLLAQSSAAAARNAVISSLLQQPSVALAQLSSDQHTITIQYKDGLRGAIMTAAPGTSGGRTRPLKPRSFPRFGVCPFPAGLARVAAGLILAPFYDRFTPYDGSYEIASSFVGSCVNAGGQPVVNENVTIDLLATLTRYSIIAIYTHGGILQGASGEEAALATRIPYTTQTYNTYISDFKALRLQQCNVDGTPGTFICATAGFFNNISKVEKFPGSIVFANGCETVGSTPGGFNYTLRDAFLGNGANTYLGWKDAVSINFNGPIEEAYFNNLTTTSLPLSQRTTGVAYQHLTSVIDPTTQEGYNGSLYQFGNNYKTICDTGVSFTVSSGGYSAADGQALTVLLPPSQNGATITLTTTSGGDLSLDGVPVMSLIPGGNTTVEATEGSHTLALTQGSMTTQSQIIVTRNSITLNCPYVAQAGSVVTCSAYLSLPTGIQIDGFDFGVAVTSLGQALGLTTGLSFTDAIGPVFKGNGPNFLAVVWQDLTPPLQGNVTLGTFTFVIPVLSSGSYSVGITGGGGALGYTLVPLAFSAPVTLVVLPE